MEPAASIELLRGAKRINVTGNVAAGKSTVARELGCLLGVPVIHMDRFVWLPGWNRRPDDEKLELVVEAAASDTWIIDGVSEHVRSCCDAIVFLDLSTVTALRRAIQRLIRLRSGSQPELGPGFPELKAWRSALRLARRFNRRIRPGIMADLERIPIVVRISSPREIKLLVRELQNSQFAKFDTSMAIE